jgi:putative membrane protein
MRDLPATRTPLIHLLHGLLMGTADAIPGVSGGTMALIVGIYERLIASIGAAFRAVVALIRLRPAEAAQEARSIEWRLVVPLGAGIATAIVIAAHLIETLIDRFPSESRGLFLGMVAASLTSPWSRIRTRTTRAYLLGVVAAGAAFVLSGLPPGAVEDPSMGQVFLSAAVAICAMILPGVSGAFLLLVLGMYEPTLAAVRERDLGYVAAFGAGAGIGLGVFSVLLNLLLRRHHDTTMAVLVGLMLGSLRALWPWQDEARVMLAPESVGSALPAVAATVVGLAVVLGLERWGRARVLAQPVEESA